MTNPTLDRITGGLLGVHAGDSLGATLEFTSPVEARRRYPEGLREIVGGGAFGWRPGDATDDTDLTVAIVDAYVAAHWSLSDLVRAAADNMLAWKQRGPRDIGGATASGLSRYAGTGDPYTSGGTSEGSQGNGSLMRTVAVGLVRTDPDQRYAEAEALSAVTHAHRACTLSCAAYSDMVHALVDGASPTEAVEFGVEMLPDDVAGENVQDAIRRGVEMTNGADWPGATGWVLDSLTLSVWALLDGRPFEDVMVDIVMHGGDADTNGACAGGLVGAHVGASAIPARWVERLQYRDHLTTAAERLFEIRQR